MVLFFPGLPEDPFLGLSENDLLIISTTFGWGSLAQSTVSMPLCYYYWRFVSARGHVHFISQWLAGSSVDRVTLGNTLGLN